MLLFNKLFFHPQFNRQFDLSLIAHTLTLRILANNELKVQISLQLVAVSILLQQHFAFLSILPNFAPLSLCFSFLSAFRSFGG